MPAAKLSTQGAIAYSATKVVENFRPLRVVVIGAGFSGIYHGIRIPERLRNVDLTIYEKNPGIGGTWYENRYPGCACDVPAHSYQYTFEPNPHWSQFYAPAAEILKYLESVVEKYSVGRFVRTSHKVTDAKWIENESKWHVSVENLQTGDTFVDEADVVISARGNTNVIAWPDIQGVRDMKIPVMHSAAWDTSFDFENKTIGIIGGGSSSIQIVPNLQKLKGTKLKCFVRSKTWIARPMGDHVAQTLGVTQTEFSQEQIKQFAENPQLYLEFRNAIERDINFVHSLTHKDSDIQKFVRADLTNLMSEKLATKPHILKSLLPGFSVACRRLTPGPGYLEALVEDNVEFINTPIERAESTAITLKGGKREELDVLICATGFDTSGPPPFTVIGRDGQKMQPRFDPYPETYLGVAMDGFPNYFTTFGPNSSIGTGSLTPMIERLGDYIIKCIRKLQKENISSMEPKVARVKDFSRFIDEYFKGTVYMDDCHSWYRARDGKRIAGLWPGSALHAMETLRSPRWEDFEYSYSGEEDGKEGNRLSWLGQGWAAAQIDPNEGELAHFVQPELLDVPAAPFPEETRQYKMLAFSH